MKLILPGKFHSVNSQDENLKVTSSVALKDRHPSIPELAGVGLNIPDQRVVQFCGFGLELRHYKYL